MANINCPDCKGTGKIELFISTVPCNCLSKQVVDNNYADAVFSVNQKWMDACCSCHISPPCGFCTRYADADLDEPEYCDACGDPYPQEQARLYKCPKCGKYVCSLCCCGIGTICIDCTEAEE